MKTNIWISLVDSSCAICGHWSFVSLLALVLTGKEKYAHFCEIRIDFGSIESCHLRQENARKRKQMGTKRSDFKQINECSSSLVEAAGSWLPEHGAFVCIVYCASIGVLNVFHSIWLFANIVINLRNRTAITNQPALHWVTFSSSNRRTHAYAEFHRCRNRSIVVIESKLCSEARLLTALARRQKLCLTLYHSRLASPAFKLIWRAPSDKVRHAPTFAHSTTVTPSSSLVNKQTM